MKNIENDKKKKHISFTKPKFQLFLIKLLRCIVYDFNIQYFILIWRFLMKLNDVSHLCLHKNHIIVLIVTCHLLFIFEYIGWHWYLYKNVWLEICQCYIWYDMIWYDMIYCLCISMYDERHCCEMSLLINLLIFWYNYWFYDHCDHHHNDRLVEQLLWFLPIEVMWILSSCC